VFNIIGRRKYGYILSAIAVTTGLLFILATLIPNGNVALQFSIAYTGGTIWEVGFEDGTPDPVEVRAILEEQGLPGSEVAITSSDARDYVLIRTEALALIETELAEGSAAAAAALAAASASPEVSTAPEASTAPLASEAPLESIAPAASAAAEASPEASAQPSPETSAPSAEPSPEASAPPSPAASAQPSPGPDPSAAPIAGGGGDSGIAAGVPTEGQFGELAAALQVEFGRIDEVRQQNSVGPVVSAELIQQTFLLILFAAAAIMVWVTYRFRDFRMGVTAIVALVHDVIIVVGAFALLGTVIGLQIDALFVTAMLTVIGYSVHDTIVVFDRIRENRQRYLGEPLEDIVNHSLVQTLGRSLTTSLTLALTLVALMLFGGEAIRPFTFALLIGVIAGTYSSIFVATPLFLDWHLFDDRRKAAKTVETNAKAKPSAA
jgi:preprotein translocase SecF subunit